MPSVKPKPQLIYISYQDIWYNPISAHYILYSHEKCQQFFRLLSIFFFSLHSFLHEMSFGKKGVSSWCYMACLFYHCGAEEAPFVMNEFIHEQCWGDVENMSHNISWIMICIYIFKHLAFAINASDFRMSPTNKVRKLKGRYSTIQKKEVCFEQNTPNKLNRLYSSVFHAEFGYIIIFLISVMASKWGHSKVSLVFCSMKYRSICVAA